MRLLSPIETAALPSAGQADYPMMRAHWEAGVVAAQPSPGSVDQRSDRCRSRVRAKLRVAFCRAPRDL
jgi:hypothetical protein